MIEHHESPPSPSPSPSMDLAALRPISVLGRGAKGVVFSVRHDSGAGAGAGDLLAFKAISRSSVHNKAAAGKDTIAGDEDDDDAAYRRVWFERDVLLELHHPLLPTLRGVVSTNSIVGFAIDHCSGGDLSSLRRRQTESMFSDDIIRFYAAEMVLALEYLHGLGIVYRDLKPENILIQENGHLMLVDFDLSARLPCSRLSDPDPSPPPPPRRKQQHRRGGGFKRCFCFSSSNAGVSPEVIPDSSPAPECCPSPIAAAAAKSNSFVGTEEYIAPEIISGGGHDFAVDWWSLGVVLYEMLYGRTPFLGGNRKETFYRILSKAPELAGEKTPLRDLISRLLEKDPARRISCDGVKAHGFFRGVEWGTVLLISRPPFLPPDGAGDAEGEAVDVEKVVMEAFNDRRTAASAHKEGSGGAGDGTVLANIVGDFKDY